MFTNTPSDRVQLVGLGELLPPGYCMICKNGNCEEGYAKLDVFYDYEGEQYLCRLCVIQVAELFGCLTPEEAQHLQEQANKLASDYITAVSENEVLNERLRVFNDALAGVAPTAARMLSGTSGDEVKQSEPDATTVDAGTTETSGGGKSDPEESVKESGPADVSESKLSDPTESPSGIGL